MTSIRKVADAAGVSIATVSRVVNGNTRVAPELRERVLQAVKEHDYSPQQGRSRATSVAMVYTGLYTVDCPYDSRVIAGAVEAMRRSPFDLQIVDLNRDKKPDEAYSQFFLRKGICGVIARINEDPQQRQVVEQIASEGVPLVVIGDHFEHKSLRFVYNCSRDASAEAIDHLVSWGHRRIAFASCERNDGDHRDRFWAYSHVLEEHGLLDESLVYRLPPQQLDGAQLIRRILAQTDPPTAAYFADPLVAVGALNEAHRMGVRIPDDFSMVGFDDGELRNMVYPEMTAVCQDCHEVGRMAFKAVADGRAGEEGAATTVGKAWLKINHSTGPAAMSSSTVAS
ncbi:MAG: LacI family DNA-binding transcriptional regulator [Planctomycetota bacterium]